MADYPPYMNAYGRLTTILKKIQEAKTPPRFTQDFVSTVLKAKGGGAKAFIPLAKRIGLLASDGSPTEIYKRFRNPNQSGIAMAEALKKGYADLFERNEFAHKLDKAALKGLVKEATGLEEKSQVLGAICGTFEALKSFSDFDRDVEDIHQTAVEESTAGNTSPQSEKLHYEEQGVGLNLAYTINLVLPKTDDIAVFNAIFESLRRNLLRK